MLNETYRKAVESIDQALASPERTFAIHNACKVDARGIVNHAWVLVVDGVIKATGVREDDLTAAIGDRDVPIIDAHGALLMPGYVDIHAHGAWEHSFDDGFEGIRVARAYHMMHGTTRQVLSLITNPLDVMQDNLHNVKKIMQSRPDVLGSHLEGPFLALSRKGAHDPQCLVDPTPERVEALLQAADGTLRQITIAPERGHGMEAIRRFVSAGVVPAIGHCDADYDTARQALDAGCTIMTHMFNAMNGIHHRKPGPIPAVLEDPRVTIELINDGFHVQNPVLKMAFASAPHRIAMVTDSMAATGCADGSYKLGALEVTVKDGHARLVANGAIAGSTLILQIAVQRAVQELGIGLAAAVEAATLTPAHALGLDCANAITGAPLGLLAPGYAADMQIVDAATFEPTHVWCDGHQIK